ncbi:hypothetical protein [uncultured Sphingorhabdus sp.]|uniref:hypothetical protein n=1 Tax=uncultured Sphingorhabdus sp. TaxID=1686106 RepID=UPI00260A8962|nr:hypothetical protein [uncultured Sphingorhabdus sp.]HMS20041.1 hypothetical protein [Sphingorhabdus sp.]
MTSVSDQIIPIVFRLAMKLSPPERRDWLQAMQAEMYFVSDSNAVSFALGCLLAIVRVRVSMPETVLGAARWTLVLGAVAWSGLHLRLAGRLAAFGAATPSTLAYFAAAVIAVGALLMAAKGLRVAVFLAAPVTVFAGLVALGADKFVPQSIHAHFYRAIAIEYVFILLAAILIATGVPRWVEKQKGLAG